MAQGKDEQVVNPEVREELDQRVAAQKEAEDQERPFIGVVRYIGLSDARVIRKQDWKAVGVTQGDCVWIKDNKFEIPIDKLSSDAVNWCDGQSDFVVVPLAPKIGG